ncbi:hypothetical protein EDC32_10869 [Laceyella sacchari]|nr:hypothetical protein [Laceyella sacchari]TCW35357.1 hypothetical protein EDC32_10869 [Laceyella sacchari]
MGVNEILFVLEPMFWGIVVAAVIIGACKLGYKHGSQGFWRKEKE